MLSSGLHTHPIDEGFNASVDTEAAAQYLAWFSVNVGAVVHHGTVSLGPTSGYLGGSAHDIWMTLAPYIEVELSDRINADNAERLQAYFELLNERIRVEHPLAGPPRMPLQCSRPDHLHPLRRTGGFGLESRPGWLNSKLSKAFHSLHSRDGWWRTRQIDWPMHKQINALTPVATTARPSCATKEEPGGRRPLIATEASVSHPFGLQTGPNGPAYTAPMSRWLLIRVKDTPSGCFPVLAIPAFFVAAMLLGLTGELVQVQILGNTTPIAQRGVGMSFLIGAITWLVIGVLVWVLLRLRKRRP